VEDWITSGGQAHSKVRSHEGALAATSPTRVVVGRHRILFGP
jgi:hypothetical protein